MTAGVLIPLEAAISGPAVVASGASALYSIVVTFNHGERKLIREGLSKSFAGGSLHKNMFIAEMTAVDLCGAIRGVYSLNGVTVTAELAVKIEAPVNTFATTTAAPIRRLTWVEIVGESLLISKQESQYSLRVHYSDGSTSIESAHDWTCTHCGASITSDGTLTAPYATSDIGEHMVLRAMYLDPFTSMIISAVPKTITINK